MPKFKELCAMRYSCRNYAEQAVEDEKLQYIMECVRLAPSAVNRQPWQFMIVKDGPLRDIINNAYAREWMRTAPVVVVCLADRGSAWVRPSDGKNHADIDLAIAIEHLVLAAADQGLGSCWVCNFDAPLFARTFPIPEGLEAIALIPLGYPDVLPTEKKRKALEEIVDLSPALS
ncbi:MAG: nitroreductase family protein [Bacteroidaceae bacterium]|nr:nitroreductase family protein [Bacteroidaceae bacterium]